MDSQYAPGTPRPHLRTVPAGGTAHEELSNAARLVIGAAAITALGASLAIAARPGSPDWSAVAFLATLALLAERLDINLYGGSRVSLSALFLLTTAVALGPTAVIVVALVAALAGHVGSGRATYKLLFNGGLFVLSSLASAYVYMGMTRAGPTDMRMYEAGAVVVAGMSDFAVSSALVTLVIACTTDRSASDVWREKFRWLAPHFALLGVLAFALSLGYETFGAWGIIAFIIPALMTRLSMKQYVDSTEKTVVELRTSQDEVKALNTELERAYNDTLGAIVAALDLRDTETHGHSARVAQLSLEIGLVLGIEPESQLWIDLKHGAMLHDVGKIGVADAILRKPGPLDEGEWTLMRQHPSHGYRMLQGVPFLEGAAELVLAHHERFDGLGYPRGLKEAEIPLGARIFAVADAFDAITSPRAYKPARSVHEACCEVAAHSGTQFDPRVVAVLLHLKSGVRRAA